MGFRFQYTSERGVGFRAWPARATVWLSLSIRLKPRDMPAPLSVLLLVTAVAGCAGSPPSTVPGPALGGTYVGRFIFEGRRFEAILNVSSTNGRVAGSFRVSAPIEIQGDVDGVGIDDLLRLTVTYEGSMGCNGRIEGILDVLDQGTVLEGPVRVEDCGPPVAGHMSFRRSASGTPNESRLR